MRKRPTSGSTWARSLALSIFTLHGACRKLAPILEEIAGEYAGKIDVYKIDVDKEPELAAAFGVQSIPTLLFCPMKNQPQIAAGFMDKATLQKAIKEVLLVK